ncbi:peptidoglycan D,D-transpeptidase FtsI family protein [Moraxella caviae]|nr:penicillin-binding protein 2 [Moraxella caviae]
MKTTKKTGAASTVTPPLRKKHATKANPAKGLKGKNLGEPSWFSRLLTKIFGGKKRRGASMLGGKQDLWRYRAIWVVMVAAFGVLFARAFYLQVINASFYVEKGDKLITSKRSQPVYRGMITDTMGAPLAANAPLSTVVFDPREYASEYYRLKKIVANNSAKDGSEKNLTPAQLSARAKASQALADMSLVKLAATTNVPLERLENAVKLDDTLDLSDPKAVEAALPKGAGSRRMVLLNRVSPEIAAPIMALDFVAVNEEKFFQRYYLQAEPNAPLLGYMAQSNSEENGGYAGRAGIEQKYEKTLAGERGQVLVLKDARASAIKEIKEIKPEIAGQDLHLTIDSRLQYVLYKELEQVGREQSARSSSGMVVDVQTGDVLAMGSWPSFNSNNLSERTGANERNRPVLDVFEPGSVMKPFTVAAALDSGKYSTSTLIDTSPGVLHVGGFNIRDGSNYGAITLAKLIQKSSNVGSAKIALNLPAEAIVDMQRKFGFGQKTALEFPAEAAGRVTTPKAREYSRRATLSYGYGLQVTLAQLAQAYSVLANNGNLQPLRLIKDDKLAEPTQVISAGNAQSIVKMMELVTQAGGTARAAAINGYRVAGKTGTSRRVNPQGGYYTDQHRTIFAGLAPASNPRFVVVILVEDPRRQSYAGQVSAPVFHNVMKEALRLYNVPFDKPLQVE